jgi:hypothetical protein
LIAGVCCIKTCDGVKIVAVGSGERCEVSAALERANRPISMHQRWPMARHPQVGSFRFKSRDHLSILLSL